jgi:Mrp family chromosome partitioning ATPase
MGRVYNALLRSDRWKDRSRPIASPASPAEDRRDGGQPSPAAEPAAPQIEREPEGPFVFEGAPELDEFAPAALQQPIIDDLALDQFARDQLAAERIAQEPATVAPDLPKMPAPSRLRVAPVPPPAPAFVEPRRRANVASLSVDPHLAAVASTDDLAGERYRTLAVRLINFASKRKLKTLLVTSARQGEGKSTVAANVAWIMAKSGERRVLLLDADVRRPSAARMLGIKSAGGWLDMAERDAKLEDVAVRIDPNGLYVLAPGSSARSHENGNAPAPEQNAAETLTSARAEKLLKDLEAHFEDRKSVV